MLRCWDNQILRSGAVLSEPAELPDDHRQARAGEAMLARALGRARLAIFWERLWPALASVATAAGLFLEIGRAHV